MKGQLKSQIAGFFSACLLSLVSIVYAIYIYIYMPSLFEQHICHFEVVKFGMPEGGLKVLKITVFSTKTWANIILLYSTKDL